MKHRSLPPPSIALLNPPVRGYTYFDAAAAWPFAPAAGASRPSNHWWLAEHALLSYDDPAVIERELGRLGYRVQCCLDPATSGFAYLAWRDDHGVLAFRGTEVMTPGDRAAKLIDILRDWAVDAHLARVEFLGLGQAHAGFARALAALWPLIAPQLKQAPRWTCTGHSLGGALAALAALRLRQEGHALDAVITFGQPRAGDAAIARALDALPMQRLVNACDLVPRVPPEAFGYAHGGPAHHFDAERLKNYPRTVAEFWRQLPANLAHGVGALTPIELVDHAPLHYVVRCYNAAIDAR